MRHAYTSKNLFTLGLKKDKDISVSHNIQSYLHHFLVILTTHTKVQKQPWKCFGRLHMLITAEWFQINEQNAIVSM